MTWVLVLIIATNAASAAWHLRAWWRLTARLTELEDARRKRERERERERVSQSGEWLT